MADLLRRLSPFTPFVFVLLAGGADRGDDNWPQWRGPRHNGVARGYAPTSWSDTENIKWKVDIPGRGHSTPVIWGNKLFLTTAIPTGKEPDQPVRQQASGQGSSTARRGRGGEGGPQQEHRFEVICLNKNNGKVFWQKTAKVAVPHEGFHQTYGSFASSSPVTDGKRVYAFFGSRGLYCYDLDGRLLWDKDFGQMRIKLQFGEGIAPALYGDALILNFDHEAGSFIVAVHKETGKELWRVTREEGSSWSTPLVVDHGGKTQVVVGASNKVRSYDLKMGALIWECVGLGSNVIPAPVYERDLLYVMSGHRDPKLMAIRLGNKGDLTGSDAIVWSRTRGLSYTPSPVLHEGKLYVVSDQGFVSCFSAATGEPFYHQVRLSKPYNFKASPVAVGGKLYLATEDEDVVVLKMGEKYEVLATNTLADQSFIASPAIVAGDIFLRSRTRLYCISTPVRN